MNDDSAAANAPPRRAPRVRRQARLATVLLASTLVVRGGVAAAQSGITISTGEWAPFVSESLEHYGIAPRITSSPRHSTRQWKPAPSTRR